MTTVHKGKKPTVGTCELHRGPATLINGHAVPRFVFKRMYDAHGQFVEFGGGASQLKHDQRQDYMLCRPCEDRFGKLESHVSKLIVQRDGSFPALRDSRPVYLLQRSGDVRSAAGLDADAIGRLAIAVFWRAAVSSKYPDFHMRQDHREAFRAFLHEEKDFPANACLTLSLFDTEAQAHVRHISSMPSSRRLNGSCHEFGYLIFGMQFTCWIGDIPGHFHMFDLMRSKMALVSDGKAAFEWLANAWVSSPPVGPLARRTQA